MSTTTLERDPKLQGGLKYTIMAACASMIGFWSWTMIGPLAKYYTETYGLTEGQRSLLIATPVIVGSLARIPVGALTDRYGGRIMFTIMLTFTGLMVLVTGLVGQMGSFPLLLLVAFFLGVGGSIFAVGIPFASAWFEPHRKGLATGIFGMGMVGTACAAFFNPRMLQAFGYFPTHLIMTCVALIYACVVWFFLKDSPVMKAAKPEPVMPKILRVSKVLVTWQLCFIYAVVFGAFVAFSNFLSTYMQNIYGYEAVAGGTFAAMFAACAVLARPFGGVAADKFGGKLTTLVVFVAVAVLVVLIAFEPASTGLNALLHVVTAFFVGFGTGTIYGWLGKVVRPQDIGTVSGLVSAAGGLGGYFPPLIMGAAYTANESYAWGLYALAIICIVSLLVSLWMKSDKNAVRPS
ncbi:nitrate/nitrite transporter [Rothia sp. ZJ932]|uniref:MFS transporter n=1 Tax=Rothia sp. ZJ932 TaxID=2810516 RepID=UPI0019680C85|nr:MFS transporter [Rothia sp. ZJ932]QRZ62065.1 NarK/NasA family nitrate transporter [Rothia sp. ZJ932]